MEFQAVSEWESTILKRFGQQCHQDLNNAVAGGKKFGIFLRGENNAAAPITPSYMLNDPSYGGVTAGFYGNYLGSSNNAWASAIWWNAKVKERWKALLNALAKEFDSNPNVSFIMWKEETTRGADTNDDPNYTCEKDVAAVKEINAYAYSIFKQTPFLLELDWDCSSDFAATWHKWITDQGIGGWTIDAFAASHPYNPAIDAHAYSLYRSSYNQIVGLVFFDTWGDANEVSATEILNAVDTIFKCRYFVVQRDGAPKLPEIDAAVDAWWSSHGGVYPFTDRPISTPWK